MNVIEHSNVTDYRFDSFHEFVEFAIQHETTYLSASRCTMCSTTQWAGGTWEFARDCLTKGWAGWKSIIDTIDLVPPLVWDNRKKSYFDVCGDEVHPVLYQLGLPDCAISRKRVRRAGFKFMKMIVSPGARAGVRPEDMLNNGIAIVSLIESLFTAGIDTEIWYSAPVRSNISDHCDISITFPLRKVGSVLDKDIIYYMVSHPSAFRRIIFSARENLERITPGIREEMGFIDTCGYGSTVNVVEELFDDADIVLDNRKKFYSVEECKTWVQSEYDSLMNGGA